MLPIELKAWRHTAPILSSLSAVIEVDSQSSKREMVASRIVLAGLKGKVNCSLSTEGWKLKMDAFKVRSRT